MPPYRSAFPNIWPLHPHRGFHELGGEIVQCGSFSAVSGMEHGATKLSSDALAQRAVLPLPKIYM